ncbi:MAG: hypothetical protein CLLPBCKN_007305 [Chroococcidiopsis cubana SAG 39.79]|uniref:hypothetical protein n=1 Tax=Chroococcidiopsis cubana TaxID=171392 RepID=UPI000D052BB5|nr:hypothetical protein [Chroococcidiopsis cubana]MDZ4877870.1 hypothetical protein [Chroococcidiopsis cubana SAG 39.79]PSB62764.1 hypothetical protein C7B79_16705 [Chroococcidiopsis cubana CCALA 043]
MGLGHIFRELLGDDRHGHHRQDRHNKYRDRDRHHNRHHDYDHRDEHHDYYYDYGDREDCHSIPSRSRRYQSSYHDEMAASNPVVICLSCERENPHDAKFCIECGSVLRISH